MLTVILVVLIGSPIVLRLAMPGLMTVACSSKVRAEIEERERYHYDHDNDGPLLALMTRR